MRERDRELKRRRHRRVKRLKKRHNEEAAHRVAERPTGSKRAVKKAPPAPAEGNAASQGSAVGPAPAGEAPKKKPAAKKAPAKKAPAPAESETGNAEGSSGPEEPQGS
jgi:large subunit ribosomal protein L22